MKSRPARRRELLAWLAFASLASMAPFGALPAAAADVPADVPSVADALRSQVKTLSRPIYTWSYAARQKIGLPAEGPIEPEDPALAKYLQGRFGRYWDLSLEPHPYSMASGLYVAADPVASRAFGGVGEEAWSLLQMVLGRGFRFVDVRAADGERSHESRFPPAVIETLAKAGCDAVSPAGLITMLESRACRAVAVRTMADLGVDGILYDFRSAPLAGCGSRPAGAFILTRAEAVDLSSSRVFTAQAPWDGAGVEDRLRIRELFERARQAGSLRSAPWPELAGIGAPAGMEEWMREHLLGCGDHAEDDLPKPPGGALAAARPSPARTSAGALEEALRRDPDDVRALEELALLRATSDDPALRDPAEAVRLAERLVGVTQYRRRLDFPKDVKVRASMALATAYAAAGKSVQALEYAEHAVEISSRQHAEPGTPPAERMAADAKALLERIRSAGPAGSPLAEVLRPRLRTLSRPVYTFHYAPRTRVGLPPSGYVAPDDPALPAFLRGKVERFWDLSVPTREGAAASGLWAGIDPVAGRHFGGAGDGWALAEIVLPEGFRFLDVREGAPGRPDPGFPPEARRLLAGEGCAVAHPAGLFMAAESPECRRIAVRVLQEIGADGLLGSFPHTRFEVCGDRPSGVFVLLDPAFVAPDRVRLLTREPGPAGPAGTTGDTGDAAAEERLRIGDLFARARAVGSTRPPPWPELAGSPPPAGPAEMDAWIREHLLGCGGWPEDRPFASTPASAAAAEARP